MGFLLSLKQNCPRNKSLATFLLNIFQIELILSLLITLKAALYLDASQFIFHKAQTNTQMIDLGVLVFNLLILGLSIQQGNSNNKSNLYSKMIHTVTINFIKMFPYIGFIPMVFYSLTTIRDQEVQSKIIAGVNITLGIIFYELNQISNWAYRFIEVDYCNQRNSNQFSFALILIYLIVSIIFSPLYATFIYLARALFKILIIYQHYDYPLIQKVDLFYALFVIYLFLIAFGTSFFGINLMDSFREFTLLSIFALFVCFISLNPIVLRLNHQRIKNCSQITLMDKDQRESLPQNLSKTIEETENVLRILTHVFLEKQKKQESEPNQYSKWWQIFNRVVMIHRVQCQKPKCICNTVKKNPKAESMVYIIELLKKSENLYLLNTKMYNLKIMSIYLFMQIAKKPLKAYYEIMRLKQQKINSDTDLELEYLIKETRECFDQVFLKNKAKNQELELIKVIEYEELMINLNKNLDDIIEEVINFHELFLYSTIKASSIKTQSVQIFQKKQLLENQVYNIILNYSENARLNLIIFIFYRYLEVYKSNESELKKISSQQMLKKRIYRKNEANIFSPEFGSIHIDLVEERGKILNLTSNMCEAFGYTRQQMVTFNIRRYMPTIYARHHDKFLSNFVEKGKIKLLKERERVIFARNKKKFIFPVNVRLKAEYLLENQFGSSSLINAVETNSEFMMVGPNGKLQELTENIYKKTFGSVFRQQVIKCNRLSAFKLLPSLNRIHDPSEEGALKANRIYQGVLLYSLSEQLLIQKFRYSRDLSISGGTTAGTSRTGSQSGARMSIMSAVTNTFNNGMPENQIIDFLTETFKVFLVDVNIFKLKGYKVSYKLSQIHTSEFELTLIEFLTFQPMEGVPFYNAVLSELRNVSQIYQLNQEHGPIAVHLNEAQQVIRENRYHEYGMDQVQEDEKKVDFTSVNDYERQVQRKRESYARNGTLDNRHIDQLQRQNQNGSDNSLVNQDANKKQTYQQYQRSQQSSVLGNAQSQSKKQILINAFNSKQSAVSKNTLFAINFVIAGLILLLILLSVFSISYVYENQFLWTDVSFILTTSQVIGFKIALLQTEIFQRKMSRNISQFIEEKKSSSVEKLKLSMEQINKNTIDSSLTDNFYTQSILMYNAQNNMSQQVTLAEFLNRYLYMLMYESEKNIENLRNNYGQMVIIFNQLQQSKFSTIQSIQKSNFQRILIILILYLFFLLLANLFIIPIYTYYKNQQSNIIGLLSYMNIREIRKSIFKLKQLKDLLKSRDNNVQNFFALVGQNSDQRRQQKQKTSDTQAKGTNKALKISSEHDGSSIKITKIICMLLCLIVFLSNFAAASFYITFTAQKYFRSNLKSSQLTFKFQNKSPLIVNTLLSNVNRYMDNEPIITYPNDVYKEGGQDFFAPVQQMSKTEYKGSKISELNKEMFSSKLCESVINCNINGPYTKSMTLSFQYLVYLFKEKFSILLPEDKYKLTSASINAWIEQNKIENYVLWLEEIISMAKSINTKIDNFFQDNQKELRVNLLICAFVLIPINIFIIIYAETRFLRFLNAMLMETQDIFRHFNVSVLVQNTYLTSYFNSKIKQNK